MTDYFRVTLPPPTGFGKLLHINWVIVFLICVIGCMGFLVLYSVAGGSMDPWASAQMQRFAFGIAVMLAVALTPLWFWQGIAVPAYAIALILLVLVEFFGQSGMGAKRWIDLGFVQLQPSEFMKIALVLMLATYYDRLSKDKVSHPVWIAVPIILIVAPSFLVFKQPDLGTAILVAASGFIVMLVAGVSLYFFAGMGVLGIAAGYAVRKSEGTDWQLISDYQFRRINGFLDPGADPQGAGYHITQSKIALGSGGVTGRGYMKGTQSQLNFLPEKHTDFVFTTLAEEFGLVWGLMLLALYALILALCIRFAIRCTDRFCSLLVVGLSGTFFLYFSLNLAMVTGLAPVVGVPLPFISYGGSALLVLLIAFGLIQCAHVHQEK